MFALPCTQVTVLAGGGDVPVPVPEGLVAFVEMVMRLGPLSLLLLVTGGISCAVFASPTTVPMVRRINARAIHIRSFGGLGFRTRKSITSGLVSFRSFVSFLLNLMTTQGRVSEGQARL
jgi:hypothetical protein